MDGRVGQVHHVDRFDQEGERQLDLLTHLDFGLAIVGLLVGFVVGITGMGGGALMTPILVILFQVQPLAAVSSDLVASFFMKPVGAAVHYRRRTIEWPVVFWLVVGSVPSAFAGVLLLRLLGHGRQIQQEVQIALGVALILAAAAIAIKAVLQLRMSSDRPGGSAAVEGMRVRPLLTVAVGIAGGLVVGITSVGSGSLIIVALMLVYPRLTAQRLVGTDLAQAIPLVGSAAIGHLLFGDFRLVLTASLLLGAIPGVFLGAQASSQAPSGIVKRAIAFVLLASGLKLVNMGAIQMGLVLSAVVLTSQPTWLMLKRVATRSLMTQV